MLAPLPLARRTIGSLSSRRRREDEDEEEDAAAPSPSPAPEAAARSGNLVRDLETPRSGFDAYAESQLQSAGGRQMRGKGNKGMVYMSGPYRGRTREQAYERMRADYAAMPDRDRSQWEDRSYGRDVTSSREQAAEDRHYAAREIAAGGPPGSGYQGDGSPAGFGGGSSAPGGERGGFRGEGMAGSATPNIQLRSESERQARIAASPLHQAPQRTAPVSSTRDGTSPGAPGSFSAAESADYRARAIEGGFGSARPAEAAPAPAAPATPGAAPAPGIEGPPDPRAGWSTVGAAQAADRYSREIKAENAAASSGRQTGSVQGASGLQTGSVQGASGLQTGSVQGASGPEAVERKPWTSPPDGREALRAAAAAVTPGIAHDRDASIRSDRGRAFGEGVRKAVGAVREFTSQSSVYDREVDELKKRRRQESRPQARSIE